MRNEGGRGLRKRRPVETEPLEEGPLSRRVARAPRTRGEVPWIQVAKRARTQVLCPALSSLAPGHVTRRAPNSLGASAIS